MSSKMPNGSRPFVTSGRPRSAKGKGPAIAKTLHKDRPEELSLEN